MASIFTGLGYTIPGYLSVAISVWILVVTSVVGSIAVMRLRGKRRGGSGCASG